MHILKKRHINIVEEQEYLQVNLYSFFLFISNKYSSYKTKKQTLFRKDLNFRKTEASMSSLRTNFAMMKPTHLGNRLKIKVFKIVMKKGM